MIPTPDDELDDFKWTLMLLDGTTERNARGQPQKRYLNKDEELVARKAIARLLRSPEPLDSAIRQMLAALFAPEREPGPTPTERILIFKGRYRGGAKMQHLRKLAIATAVEDLGRTKSREDAIQDVAQQFSVSVRTVETAVAYLKTIIDRTKTTDGR